MRACALAAVLLLIALTPARAQGAAGRVTASATVVEPISLRVGRSTAAAAHGGAIDVTTPLAVGGSAAHVVRVVAGASSILAPQRTPAAASTASGDGKPESAAWSVRLPPPSRGDAERAVTYVVATIN
jgi:hypothetical protein